MQTNILEQLKQTAANLGTPIKSPRPRAFAVMAGATPQPYYQPPAGGSFGAKLRKAVKTLTAPNCMSQKEHEEFVERENARYRPFLQRREHCRGE